MLGPRAAEGDARAWQGPAAVCVALLEQMSLQSLALATLWIVVIDGASTAMVAQLLQPWPYLLSPQSAFAVRLWNKFRKRAKYHRAVNKKSGVHRRT